MWTQEVECEDVIDASWNGNIPGVPLMDKFRLCSNKIHHWAKKKFKSLPQQIKNKRDQLANLRNHHCWQNEMTGIIQL